MTSAAGPRKIVPLVAPHEVEEIGAVAAPAHLNYHNGPLLTAAQVVTVFWGSEWQQAPQDALVSGLNGFFDFILTSPLMDQLAEYSAGGNTIGHGSRIGTFTITDSEPGSPPFGSGGEITDDQIQQALQGWINAGTVPAVTENLLYFIYLPPNVTTVLGTDKSCQQFCGYHNHFGNNIYYAVEPYLTCDGCTFGQDLDSLTKVSSHELCEAITDPAGDGWWDDGSGDEIGDICNIQVGKFGGYTIQSEWSNQQNACVMPQATG